ncbi:hypothetical protein MVEN_01374900 [Mycena venus]|uniref:Uncharacterized protein n=1 Tax=Mycena venus TaxID=2733690 RepID=A0A8H6XUV4_9AGAR|nr:hypothetical protein MVEN_01374900 [Mycena venus]
MFLCFLQSAYLSWSSDPEARRNARSYILFGGLLLALLTISVFTNSVFLEFMWIDHRDTLGGPLGFLASFSSVWWQTLGTASTQVTNFLGDGLLMYRCYVIWNTRWSILVFPFILYLGSIAMAMIMLVQSALPGSDFFRGKTVDYGVPWAALSVSLNVTLTALITLRILLARRAIKQFQVSDKSFGVYFSVAAMVIESSLPFSLLGLIFAVTYGKNLDIGPAFLFTWATFAALSPQFIIFRVATGRAWTRDVASDLSAHSDIVFRHTTQNLESVELSTAVTSHMESGSSEEIKGQKQVVI